MINLVYSNFQKDSHGIPWPNLACQTGNLERTYPFVNTFRLLLYAKNHAYPFSLHSVLDFPDGSWYPLGISFFDHNIDYVALIPSDIVSHVRSGKLYVVFYYHEGDNPMRIKQRLDYLFAKHGMSQKCYIFISANSQASLYKNFFFFPDHELFYWRSYHQQQKKCRIHQQPRAYEFTALSRTHKWWRSSVMAHLHSLSLLDRSLWSYNILDMSESQDQNPISQFKVPHLKHYVKNWIAHAPYTCDSLSSDEHNSHWIVDHNLYENSYCNIVLETFFDVDQSEGNFLSEKTFKPISNGQPFVIFGGINSLNTLRLLGYRTFDAFIDNSYDTILDNTDRFLAVVESIKKIAYQNMHKWYAGLYDDVIYNHQHFVSSKHDRIRDLIEVIHDQQLH